MFTFFIRALNKLITPILNSLSDNSKILTNMPYLNLVLRLALSLQPVFFWPLMCVIIFVARSCDVSGDGNRGKGQWSEVF